MLTFRALIRCPALLLALAATAACGTGAAPASPPEHGDGPKRAAAEAPVREDRPATLPLTPDGRTPVFRHGPRAPRAEGTEGVAGTRHGTKPVALTFDADMTAGQADRAAAGERFDHPALVRLLREQRVPATFFVTGMWARTYPAQTAALGRDPLFEVGNHSFSHYAFTEPCHGLPALDARRRLADVRAGFDALRAAGVERPVPYFRFPGGCYDDAALRAIAPAGVTAVQWDVVGGDPFTEDADAVVRRVLSGVRPGSVVVLHCTRSAAPTTAEAVRRLVPALRERGYRFVRVSELLGAERG
ncbi:polysaccharide deacetylase family protein [Streptomyces sp. GSL17-111]|uniref:polysaccharide deacetylase family protein n=1 Tax=Streptomyces sp. GSL17-111 TaxID=3121596 RepID=UPI0030F3FEFC